MSAREKVAAAIQTAIHDAPHPFTPYTTVADAAIAAHLEALAESGHVVIKLCEPQQDEWGDKYWPAPMLEERDQGVIRIDQWPSGPRITTTAVSNPIRPVNVRSYVAALLAAADAAEAQR